LQRTYFVRSCGPSLRDNAITMKNYTVMFCL
jgi:hypothetical protein